MHWFDLDSELSLGGYMGMVTSAEHLTTGLVEFWTYMPCTNAEIWAKPMVWMHVQESTNH
jgi:hypothetical protein